VILFITASLVVADIYRVLKEPDILCRLDMEGTNHYDCIRRLQRGKQPTANELTFISLYNKLRKAHDALPRI